MGSSLCADLNSCCEETQTCFYDLDTVGVSYLEHGIVVSNPDSRNFAERGGA